MYNWMSKLTDTIQSMFIGTLWLTYGLQEKCGVFVHVRLDNQVISCDITSCTGDDYEGS